MVTIILSPPHSPTPSAEVFSCEPTDLKCLLQELLSPFLQSFARLQSQVEFLMERAAANSTTHVPDSVIEELKKVSFVASIILESKSFMSTQGELLSSQIFDLGTKVETIGVQTAEMTDYLKEKDEAEAKKREEECRTIF